MKPTRERMAIAICRLVEKLTLDEAIGALLWQFGDNGELASLLKESYVVGERMVLTEHYVYVESSKFNFRAKVAEVRAREHTARREQSERYIESLRKVADAGGPDAARAQERLIAEIAVHEAEFT